MGFLPTQGQTSPCLYTCQCHGIGRPPNNCLSFKTINCTETYLELYSHYPENAANSHTVFTFCNSNFKFPFGDIVVHLAQLFLVPSGLSSELCIEVVHPFCIDKARKRGCIEHRAVNHNFRNALTLHYNFGG